MKFLSQTNFLTGFCFFNSVNSKYKIRKYIFEYRIIPLENGVLNSIRLNVVDFVHEIYLHAYVLNIITWNTSIILKFLIPLCTILCKFCISYCSLFPQKSVLKQIYFNNILWCCVSLFFSVILRKFLLIS